MKKLQPKKPVVPRHTYHGTIEDWQVPAYRFKSSDPEQSLAHYLARPLCKRLYGHHLPETLITCHLKDNFEALYKERIEDAMTQEAHIAGYDHIVSITPTSICVGDREVITDKWRIVSNDELDRSAIMAIFDSIDADAVESAIDSDIYSAVDADPELYVGFELRRPSADAEAWLSMYEEGEGDSRANWQAINRDRIIQALCEKVGRPWRNYAKQNGYGKPICEAYDFMLWAIATRLSYADTLRSIGMNPQVELSHYNDALPEIAFAPIEQSSTHPIEQSKSRNIETSNNQNPKPMANKTTTPAWLKTAMSALPGITPTVTTDASAVTTAVFTDADGCVHTFKYSGKGKRLTEASTIDGDVKITWKDLTAATEALTGQFSKYKDMKACTKSVSSVTPSASATAAQSAETVPTVVTAPAAETAPTTAPTPHITAAPGLWLDPGDPQAPVYLYKAEAEEDGYFHCVIFDGGAANADSHYKAAASDIEETLNEYAMHLMPGIYPDFVLNSLAELGIEVDVAHKPKDEEPVKQVDVMALMGAVNDMANGKREEVKFNDFAQPIDPEPAPTPDTEPAPTPDPQPDTKAEAEAAAKREAIDAIRDRVLKMDIMQLRMVTSFLCGMEAQAAI